MSSEGPSPQSVGTAPRLLRDRYELGERLAEGTFFYTHRGRDAQTGRPIAIKVLRPEYAGDEAFCERLLSEAESASRLRSPHIAQVHEAWRERGTVVIAAEWVPGINLKDRIRRVAPFPLAVALDIFLACSRALQYAHESGVVHGDIRPDNIIITPDGRVKLTDFGVGASVAASTRIQLNALPHGVYYLAPEMVEGRPPNVRTDIYSLGCILYEMLAGVVPFDAETPLAVAVKHLHSPVPSLREANPAVPSAVDGMTAKCMQKDPEARYASVSELQDDIDAIRDALRSDQSLNWTPLETPKGTAQVQARKKAAPAAKKRRPEPEYEDTGPSAKLLLWVALAAVLLAVGCFALVGKVIQPPNAVSVPTGLQGMPEATAIAELERVGLKADIVRDYTDKAPVGNVFQIQPPSGTELRAGKSVKLFVSQGSEPIKVPDVVGKKLEAAQREIRAAGLVLGPLKEEFSEIVEKGEIVGQAPQGASDAPKGSAVNLVVSKGKEPDPTPAPTPVPGNDNSTGTPPDTDNNPIPDPGATPDSGGAINPGAPATPGNDLLQREREVTVRLKKTAQGPQSVRIVIKNGDGSEQTVYEGVHQPGEKVVRNVTVTGAEGKCQIRVYVNDQLFKSQNL